MARKVVVLAALAVAVAAAAWVGWAYFAPAGEDHVVETVAEGTVLAQGAFSGADAVHEVSGNVALVDTDAGQVLRFTDYDATSGPDVYLFLATGGYGEDAVKVPVPGGRDWQATKRGTFDVPVPAGVDATAYDTVLVWCERFGVLFGSAPLEHRVP